MESEENEYVSDTIALLNEVYEEILTLDEMEQIYESVESMVMQNKLIQTSNLFFYFYQIAHSDSVMIRLRRLVDKGKDAKSLVKVAKRIQARPMYFNRKRHREIYANFPVKEHEIRSWMKFAGDREDIIDANIMSTWIDNLLLLVEGCIEWITQNIAHKLKKTKMATVPTWGEFKKSVDKIKEYYRGLSIFLTGADTDCRVSIAIDWEVCLMTPWAPPTTRAIGILEQRRRRVNEGSDSE